jgi:RNA polymerase sigma-B factor
MTAIADKRRNRGAERGPTKEQLNATRPRRYRQVARPGGGATDEDALVRAYARTRDPMLKEQLARRFQPLSRSLALRYRNATEPLEDLVQVANLGLVKALNGFEPERGTTFVAYAAPTILGELRRHFRDRVWQVRLPRVLQERTMLVQKAVASLSEELGTSPSARQVAQRLRLTEEEVLEALQADQTRRTLSLDIPRPTEEGDAVPMAETVGSGEPGYDDVEAQLAADEASLDDRERQVLSLRYEDHLTQAEIGHRIGVSQMQVSRIMRRGLGKLLTAVRGGEPAAA